MRDFGIIQTRYWEWAAEENLPESAKLIGAYILTCKHGNSLGLFRLPPEYIQADLGYNINTISTQCATLSKKGFLLQCKQTGLVFLPNYLKFNPVKNSSHGVGVLKIARSVSKNFSYFNELINALRKFKGQIKSDDLDETITKLTQCTTQCTTQCGDKETETETETETERNNDVENRKILNQTISDIFSHWQIVHNHQKAKLDEKRKKKIKARLEEGYSLEDLKSAIDGCKKSPYHQGDNKTNSTYDDLELILRDASHIDKFIKISKQTGFNKLSTAGRKSATAAAEWLNGGENAR